MKVAQEKICKRNSKATNEKYLAAVFSILKKRDGIVISNKNTTFNDTELRLIGEILAAKYEGKRLISTQLAVRLGVTRSAISQIVNRLEAEGVVQRFPDAVDRKIAYVEITEATLTKYEKDIQICAEFVGKLVCEFGEEKFQQMCGLLDEFMECVKALRLEEKK